MSLQTDLHQAVAQVTADSALLHTIVHGTAAQTVTTEGGAVATVAKLLADADTRINLAADGLLAQSQAAAQDALTSAELAADEKNRRSHRGQALARLLERLRERSHRL